MSWNVDSSWLVRACDLDQAQNGCRIDNGACSCSYGCKSEYRYATLKECLDALKVTIWYFSTLLPSRNNGFIFNFFFLKIQRAVPMTYAAEDHANIVVFAFKLHKRRAIVADVKGLVTLETDANENVQMLKKV